MTAPFTGDVVRPTQCIVFFALGLDCSVPVLDALYRNTAWRQCNIVGQLIADLRSEIGQEEDRDRPRWQLAHGTFVIEKSTTRPSTLICVLPALSPHDLMTGTCSAFWLQDLRNESSVHRVCGITLLLLWRTFLRHHKNKARFDKVMELLHRNSDVRQELSPLPLGEAAQRLQKYLG